jgi:hypothetical protein
MKRKTPVAIAWYRPEQWALLKAYSSDKDVLEDSFEEWVIHAEKTFKEYKKSGMNLHKILIDIDALVAWCRENDLSIDAESRSQYAATLMKELDS